MTPSLNSLKNLYDLPEKKLTVSTVKNIPYLVIPTIFLQESVMNNVYYSHENFAKKPYAYNGIPIVVNHPLDFDGGAISAKKPAQEIVGRVYNVYINDNWQLAGDMYINRDLLIDKHHDIYDRLESGEMIEVSIGIFGDFMAINGIFEGKEYTHISTNIVPDHLAMLPNDVGACSIADGCGALRVNIDFISDMQYMNNINNNTINTLHNHCDCANIISDNTPKETEMDTTQDTNVDLIIHQKEEIKKLNDELQTAFQEISNLNSLNTINDEDLLLFNNLKAEELERINTLRTNLLSINKNLNADMVNSFDKPTLHALIATNKTAGLELGMGSISNNNTSNQFDRQNAFFGKHRQYIKQI